MNKAEFLDALQSGRAEWEALLSEVGEVRMTVPGVAGQWSVKDIVAHVTWAEREMVGIMQARALVGSDLWDLSQDERNDAIFADNRGRPLQEVLDESQQVYTQYLAGIQGLSDADLADASRFQEMPAEWIPWEMLASNCFEHYQQHIPAIRAWLDTDPRNGTEHMQ